ncbi:MAG TPA: DUF6265 family protein [Vicinamibacterales bacterium]|nr:DUF6265 family protein [Vicinamibacterales bacterium]
MQRGVILTMALALASLAGRPAAQARPDFTGTWTAVKDAPATLAAAPSAVFGARFELRHDGQTLTVIRPLRDTAVTATHTLDGSEVKTRVPGGLCMGDTAFVTSAAWEDGAIAYRTVALVPAGGGAPTPLSVKHVFRLADADTLIVESTMRAARDSAPRAVGTVYRRTADPIKVAERRVDVQPSPATIGQVAWIPGVWFGTAGTSAIEERWTPAGGGSMIGVSRTLRNNVMTSFEFLCIAERDGSLVYTAMPNGRTPPTDFTLTRIDADSATFENPAHDFPKMIRYTKRPDGALEAVISGDASQRAVTFVFKRQE